MMDAEMITRIFRAFSDEHRLQILEALKGCQKCGCVLSDDLAIGQSTLSYHMKILCDSGIVDSRKAGKWTYYSISQAGCKQAIELLNYLITPTEPVETSPCCAHE